MRVVALVGCLALTACDGCEETNAPPVAPEAPAGAVQPWTLGAARTRAALVLPPPCVEREPTLMAVLERNTRIVAQADTLGRLWVAEGPSATDRWHADASGIVTLTHGRTAPVPAPWPQRGTPVVALSNEAWLLAYDADAELRLWWRNESRPIADNRHALGLDCDGDRCALLGDDGTVWIGAPSSTSPWRRVALSQFGEAPIAVKVRGEEVVVAMRDALRARFVTIAGETAPTSTTALGIAPELLALTIPAAVMTEPPYHLVDGCPNEGGVVVNVDGLPSIRMRSPQPPKSGKLATMARGWLAAWIAPVRCRSRRQVLHAAVIGRDGRPVAPVTTVGHADAIHIATQGHDVDLWLRHHADNTVTWVRAACR